MSIIHVNQIATKVKELFGDLIDTSDLNKTDSQYELKKLSRCLAAYAVFCIGGSSEIEAASSVIDGANDNGIDAIYYSPATKRMILVQSKWSIKGTGEPDNGDIRKFKDGVSDLVSLSFDRFNSKVEKMRNMVEAALTAFDTKFDIVLVHTGNKLLSEHNQRIMDDLVLELNDAGDGSSDDIVIFHQLNQARIHTSLAKGVEGEPIKLEVGLSQWGKIEDPYLAFFGIVSGDEVYEWYKLHGNKLFSKNIRQMLGSTDVNDEIKNTIENHPDKFWYYNNGITLIADKVKKSMAGGNAKDIGSFQLSNISVVNGAQTVSSIGVTSESKKEKLIKVRVPIKIISLENTEPNFGSYVTKNNNRQNRIENRDFVSLDDQQIRLRTELAIDGIEYCIVRSELFKPTESSFDLIEATTALACVSKQSSLAVQAKREIGKFYENLNKPIYKSIFNQETTGKFIFNSVMCLRAVEKLIKKNIKLLESKSGRNYGILVHGNRMLALLTFSKLNINESAKSSNFMIDENKIEDAFNDSLNELDEQIETYYQGKILSSLFKNFSICKNIYQNII
ncbi:AIPR family protein [Gilliamella apicola]|uniref:AIPR family protein n=1 Tax=Gilliamella apicola TaxID=1196095 RepID=UPI0039864CB6